MNKHLCSKNFQAFFDTLIADSFPSANLIHEEMKKQINNCTLLNFFKYTMEEKPEKRFDINKVNDLIFK